MDSCCLIEYFYMCNCNINNYYNFVQKFMGNMQSSYCCPRCQSRIVLEYDDVIECLDCSLTFTKDILEEVDDEHVLSQEELGRFLDAFEELKDEKKRRNFLKSLDKDLS